ncbi:hypothetical protein [Kitasatospora sp. NPDC056181]|uniref:hypothetical protein n=1 Tax=Kitasatospora sp. NPDC056181 TaxID=3345737 RepID=UPI0035D9940F
MKRTSTRRVAAALALLFTVAACGHDSDRPTMTRAEAKQRTQDYIAQVLAAFPQPVTAAAGRENDGYCFKDDAVSEEDGRVNAVTEKTLPGVPLAKHAEYVAAFRSKAEALGFTSTGSGTSLYFTNKSNDFSASIMEIGDAERTLQIGFVSPCVWPDGTKPPG